MSNNETMTKIKKWCDAIRQEDGHKLSSGSLRTLKMIEDEFLAMQENEIRTKLALSEETTFSGRCCGMCDGVNDICIGDTGCAEHNIAGCEACFGNR